MIALRVACGLALGAIACADAGPAARADAAGADVGTSQIAAIDAAPAPRRLTADWIVDRLTGRDGHFVLDLAAGEAATVTVEGREVNTKIIVDAPGGQRLFVEDLSRSVGAVEPYVIVAAAAGRYRLTVQAAMVRGAGGAYAVRAETRPATDRDRDVAALETQRYHLYRSSQGHRQQVKAAGDPADDADRDAPALFADAEPVLALARRLGDRMREARLLGFQGDLRRWQHRFDDAARLWGEALRVSGGADDRAGQGTAHSQLGLIAFLGGDIETALPHLREAVAICRAVQNAYCLAYALDDLGTIDLRVADPLRALADFRESAAVWGAQGNHYEQSMAILNSAWAYDDLGDRRRALEAVDEAEAAWQPSDAEPAPGDLAYRPLTRGRLLLNDGKVMSALPLLEATVAIARATEHTPLLVAALSARSDAYAQIHQPGIAVTSSAEAIAAADRGGLGRDRVTLLTILGEVQLAAGAPAAARAAFVEAADLAHREADDHGEAEALGGLSRALGDLGDRAAALAAIRAAVERIESTRSRIRVDDQRAGYLSAQRALYDRQVELLLDTGDASGALIAAEQARARTLRETLAAGRVRSPAMTPAQAAAMARAKEAVGVQEMAHESLLARAPTPARLAASRAELARRVEAYEAIEAEVRGRDPAFAALLAPPRLDVAALRAGLAPDDTLLVYSLGDGASALWRITRDGLEAVRLPGRAVLEAQIGQTRALLTARADERAGETAEARRARIARADASLPHALAALGPLLFGRAPLAGARLLIVPDGGVTDVPFAALPGASGGPLLLDHEIVYVPAASLLVPAAGAPAAPASTASTARAVGDAATRAPRIAIAADPVFSRDDPRVHGGLIAALTPPRPDRLLRGGGLGRLPWSGTEAARIVALAPDAAVATGFAATEARVRDDDFAHADIVHLATHSVLDGESPALSAIVLSLVDASGHSRDGFLRLHEIVELHLDASLVVLSACETALGRPLAGEGLIGLVRGFLYAGARQVLASQWRVHDQGTAELMTRFYRSVLRDHQGAGAALRAAQLAMRAEPRWSAPYYWAAFGLQGTPPRAATP